MEIRKLDLLNFQMNTRDNLETDLKVLDSLDRINNTLERLCTGIENIVEELKTTNKLNTNKGFGCRTADWEEDISTGSFPSNVIPDPLLWEEDISTSSFPSNVIPDPLLWEQRVDYEFNKDSDSSDTQKSMSLKIKNNQYAKKGTIDNPIDLDLE